MIQKVGNKNKTKLILNTQERQKYGAPFVTKCQGYVI